MASRADIALSRMRSKLQCKGSMRGQCASGPVFTTQDNVAVLVWSMYER